MSQQGLTCAVDIAFCIDVTESMVPTLAMVKDRASRFHDDLVKKLAEKDRSVTELRARLVAFRDVDYTDQPAFEVTDWMALPEQRSQFADAVSRLEPLGGGDEPESAWDALSIALSSEWTRNCDRQRHVVVLFTDASSKPPSGGGASTVPGHLRAAIAPNLDEVSDLWSGMPSRDGVISERARRLVVFGPDCADWEQLSTWDEVVWLPSEAGAGLDEVDYDSILEMLAASIASNGQA